ncbi:alpha-hydroxy acid oxidase [Paracoccus sp. SCSIO 75233]|uniref:alpha-hydroxy acid oxidase n=1 Tax=Paracoccus sp. SCSIO 75233 TaxID=3017782 RepID=UPI0022EFE260|nr:alpha-hydroxy acid oxidase [Paracoccus sp. SCSIO 75233]WBU53806.1 alpha-hydroxy acid oxidase [Paracoccus sp. SCSIO 75233]
MSSGSSAAADLARYLSFDDARRIARRKLPRGLFDYIDRGVGEEATLRALRDRLDAARIVPRILNGQQTSATTCHLFGRDYAAPFIVAPTAMAGLVHRDGEFGLARAAGAAGIPFSLSTQSISAVDEVARAAPDTDIWMQLYLWQDMSFSEGLLKRASDAGSHVLVMTVDTPAGSRKEWNIRSGFDMPFRICARSVADLALRPNWLLSVVAPLMLRGGLPEMRNFPEGLRPRLIGRPVDPGLRLIADLNWQHVDWVRERWPGKLVLKGILSVQDAEKAVSAGADGIVVSSHGARNFDASPAPIDALPEIAAQIGNRLTVLADSGIKRGLDAFRYTTRGASAVMLGRLPLWALAAGGEAMVRSAFDALQHEYAEARSYTALS